MKIEREHKALVPVNDNPTLWRYMSLSKFEKLLNDQSIYFCSVKKMAEKEDPFEGSLTRIERDWTKKLFERQESFAKAAQKFRSKIFINCWQINDHESDAMWKLYLPNFKGIAIKTNYLRLIDSLESSYLKEDCVPDNDRTIWVSKIRYIDYERNKWQHPIDYPYDGLNFLTPFVHKRKEFKHESEFRLFIKVESNSTSLPEGLNLNVNLGKLVEEIILPPKADNELESEIVKVRDEFGFHFNVRKSAMSSEVYF